MKNYCKRFIVNKLILILRFKLMTILILRKQIQHERVKIVWMRWVNMVYYGNSRLSRRGSRGVIITPHQIKKNFFSSGVFVIHRRRLIYEVVLKLTNFNDEYII